EHGRWVWVVLGEFGAEGDGREVHHGGVAVEDSVPVGGAAPGRIDPVLDAVRLLDDVEHVVARAEPEPLECRAERRGSGAPEPHSDHLHVGAPFGRRWSGGCRFRGGRAGRAPRGGGSPGGRGGWSAGARVRTPPGSPARGPVAAAAGAPARCTARTPAGGCTS